jgi:hypothetical protein
MMNNSIDHNEIRNLKTTKDAVIYYIKSLDISMVDSLLEENKTYQDFPKHIFVQKLDNVLSKFILSGDNYLFTYLGYCNSELCSNGCKGVRFMGPNSKMYIDLIFKVENEELIDVYECHQFQCLSPKINFKNKVYIDTKDLPITMM